MLLKHSAIYLLGRLISAGATFASLWLFSRLFPPADYGFYVTVITLAAVINMGGLQWLRISQMRLLPASPDKNHLRQVVLTLFIRLLVAIGLLAPLALTLFPNTPLGTVIPFSVAAIWAMSLSEFSLDVLRQRLQPVAYLMFTVTRDAALIGFALLFIKAGLEAHALLWAYIAANLLPVVVWIKPVWQGAWPPRVDKALIKEIAQYGLPLAGLYIVTALMTNADRLLLPWLSSQADAGLYGAAYGLSRQSLLMIMQSINLAALPLAFKALEAGGLPAAQKQLEQNLTLLLAIALPACVGLGVLAPLVAHTLLGAAYAPAVTHLLPWLCASALLMGIRTYYTDQAFQLAKATRTPFLIMLASACVALPLSAFCIWHYGLNGAVYGMLAAAAIALTLSWHLGQKAFPLPMPWKELGLLSLATLAMAAVCWPFRQQSGWLWLFAAVSAGGFVYATFVLLFDLAGLRRKLTQKLRRKKTAS